MIDNRLEYSKMFEVESRLWWYKILHGKVLTQLQKHFGTHNKDIQILDAACGTGGLLQYLTDQGYKNNTGFDYSEHAVDFSKERNLNVFKGDLRKVDAFQPGQKFDAICCNDALYFLTEAEIVHTLTVFKNRLNAGGLITINIHAFEAFSGTHDIAVGSSKRFTYSDFQKYSQQAGLQNIYHSYWPFMVSLPIWLVRVIQRYKIKTGRIDVKTVDSDVSYPGDLINGILYTTMKIEEKLLPKAPFGSSLFMSFKNPTV